MPVEGLDLPEPRAGASVIALADGLLLLGGVDASGAPTTTVWKSTAAANGELGEWEALPSLPEPRADGEAAIIGSHVFVYGGSNALGRDGDRAPRHVPGG